jgi:hypothetical protein
MLESVTMLEISKELTNAAGDYINHSLLSFDILFPSFLHLTFFALRRPFLNLLPFGKQYSYDQILNSLITQIAKIWQIFLSPKQ